MVHNVAMADNSFDIVSKVDRQEADNALNQAAKELAQRFDFKNTDIIMTSNACSDLITNQFAEPETPPDAAGLREALMPGLLAAAR
mgnify:CR=1 FL=1